METVVGILVPLTFVAMLVLERVFPARRLPEVPGWTAKGVVFFFVTGGLQTFLAATVRQVWPFHFATLGFWPGVAAVIVGAEAVTYAVHRWMHESKWLWRWTHQLHHSAERVDVLGASYFHPLDVLVQAPLTALPAVVFGVSPDAAAVAGYVFFFIAVFQHMNVRTPAWLGWIVLRPEQHALHHERGVHAHNYGNFAFMDLLCRTWKQADGFVAEAGYFDGASKLLWPMLRGREIGGAA